MARRLVRDEAEIWDKERKEDGLICKGGKGRG